MLCSFFFVHRSVAVFFKSNLVAIHPSDISYIGRRVWATKACQSSKRIRASADGEGYACTGWSPQTGAHAAKEAHSKLSASCCSLRLVAFVMAKESNEYCTCCCTRFLVFWLQHAVLSAGLDEGEHWRVQAWMCDLKRTCMHIRIIRTSFRATRLHSKP